MASSQGGGTEWLERDRAFHSGFPASLEREEAGQYRVRGSTRSVSEYLRRVSHRVKLFFQPIDVHHLGRRKAVKPGGGSIAVGSDIF